MPSGDAFLERLNTRLAPAHSPAYEQELQSALRELQSVNLAFNTHAQKPLADAYDVVIIGSGPGGGTLTYALRGSGKSVLLVERGDFLPSEPANWDSGAVLEQQKYANSEEWLDAAGAPYQPNMYYYVGGMTKLYAATLVRFRQQDFEAVAHPEGVSPAWPIGYADLEPHYAEAERLYLAHGRDGEDPTEPPRSGPFPYPPVPVVPEVQDLKDRLERVGLHPFAMPEGLALFSGGRCLYCAYCDSHPCRVFAKGDPELCCIRPALTSPNVTLASRTRAVRLLTDRSGRRVESVELEQDGQLRLVQGGIFAVACGAVNTPALLLRSANARHPHGLANSSGLVGARYMRHLSTMLLARNPAEIDLPQNHFWKSIGLNDFYLSGGEAWPYPLGTVQVTGNYHEAMRLFLPDPPDHGDMASPELAGQMLPIMLFSEDLPAIKNRVSVTVDGRIQVAYRANNRASHMRLIAVMKDRLSRAGYRFVTEKSYYDVRNGGGYHHCGTTCFGDDPQTSVLDRNCKAHDLDNLYVVDSSVFPSSTATNPVATIVANSLRVADHLKGRL